MAIQTHPVYVLSSSVRDPVAAPDHDAASQESKNDDSTPLSWNGVLKQSLGPSGAIPRMMMSASGKAVRDTRRALKRTTAMLYRSLQRELPQFFDTSTPDDALDAPLAIESNASFCARAASLDALHYVPGWREDVTLHDGTIVTLRTLQEGDRERMQEAFVRLSPESRYQRFMTAMDTLPDAYLTYLTDIDHVHHFAVVAEIEDPARLDARGLGIARFIELPDVENEAELAITILDEAQGMGLGVVLMDILLKAAAERGFHALRAEVLPSNTGMQKLSARAGGTRISVEDGLATWRIPVTPPADE